MASMILGAVGTAIGGPVGGFIGATIGAYIDSFIFAPSPQDVEGPRLTDLTTTRSSPGDPINLVWGGDRVAGTLIAASDIREVKTTEEQSGGKGGGSKSKPEVTTYTYFVDLDWLLSEGPILGIGRMWADGKIIRGFRETLDISTVDNPEKIGGIPYPDRYSTHLYDPELVPHSLDPTYVNTLSGFYVYNRVVDEFGAITSQQALDLAQNNSKVVVYQRDSATGYYVPTLGSHGYTGKRLRGKPRDPAPSSSDYAGILLQAAIDPFLEELPLYDPSEFVKPFRTFLDYYNLYDMLNDWSPQSIYGFSWADSINFYNGSFSQRADTGMATSLGEPDVPAYRGRAHIVFKGLRLDKFGNRIPNMTFEVIRSDNDTVSSMIVDLMDRANLGDEYYDLSALPTDRRSSFLMGYSVGRKTSFRASIEPLLELYRIDAAEIGDTLVFRPKDRSYEHVISYGDLAAASGQSDAAPLRLVYRDKLELPRSVTISFKDAERDYQQNSALYSREQVNTTQESSLQFAAVIAPDRAKIFAREKTRDVWLERISTPISLPHKYIYVSPTDVIFVDGSDEGKESLVLKVVDVTRGANGVLDIQCVVTAVQAYTPEAGETQRLGVPDSNFNEELSEDFVIASTAVLLDLPPLRSQDTDFGFYTVMSGEQSGSSKTWPGAFLYRNTLDGAEYIVIDDQAVEGVVGFVSGSPLLGFDGYGVDRVSSVEVTLNRSTMTLASETDDGIFAGRNFAIIGDEIVQFLDVTFLGDNVYRLETFVRGHLDTVDTATQNTHVVNERFALLTPNTVAQTTDTLSNTGIEREFRAVTFDTFTADATSQLFTNNGARFKPLRPVMLDYTRDGSDNITLTWERQDRLEYSWRDGKDIPLRESYEQYEVDIWSPSLSEVVRRITVDDARTITYTAAQQISDGTTPGVPIQFTVYQISDQIGRGNPATETV